MNDWHLRTNLEGLYAAGDQLFASNCHGHAAATGHYAGRHAAAYAREASEPKIDPGQVQAERARLFAPLGRNRGVGWKDLSLEVTRVMKECCGAERNEKLLENGLRLLKDINAEDASKLSASNPHELLRSLEALSVLANAELILHASLARRASSKQLNFVRTDYPEMDPPEWHKFVTVRNTPEGIVFGEKAIDYYSSLSTNYERHNRDYLSAAK